MLDLDNPYRIAQPSGRRRDGVQVELRPAGQRPETSNEGWFGDPAYVPDATTRICSAAARESK